MLPWLQWISLGFSGSRKDVEWINGDFQCFTETSRKGRTVGTIMVIPGLFMCGLVFNIKVMGTLR